MAKALTILTVPTPSLRVRSVEISPDTIATPDMQTFIDDLIATMHTDNGVGIAAPQVGRNERVIIVQEHEGPTAYINPEITATSSEEQESEEGCLSVPGVWGTVKRAKKISFRALDRHGRRVAFDAKNYQATIYQHEIDHLDGVLFIDKMETVVSRK